MKDSELDKALKDLEAQRAAITSEIDAMRRVKSRRDSLQFIAVNKITKADVEFPEGEGKPWFGHVASFADWMRNQPTKKRWMVWNGRLFHTTDLLSNRFAETPGLAEHL